MGMTQVVLSQNPALKRFIAPGPNEEAIPYVFYDQQSFAASTAIGATTAFFAASAANTEVGNTGLSGQNLPNQMALGSRFLITSIQIAISDVLTDAVRSATAAHVTDLWNDTYQFIMRTQLQLTLSGKPYLGPIPTWMLPQGGGLSGSIGNDQTSATADGFVTNGFPDPRAVFEGAWPLPPNANFQVSLTCPNTPSTAGNICKVTVALKGILVRVRP